MIAAVLDTDVFSILSEPRPQADKYVALLDGADTVLAFPSVVAANGRHFLGLPELEVVG